MEKVGLGEQSAEYNPDPSSPKGDGGEDFDLADPHTIASPINWERWIFAFVLVAILANGFGRLVGMVLQGRLV